MPEMSVRKIRGRIRERERERERDMNEREGRMLVGMRSNTCEMVLINRQARLRKSKRERERDAHCVAAASVLNRTLECEDVVTC